MKLIAIGESLKNIDKVTNKELLKNYPQVDWEGARFSEVASLTWDDIDFNSRFIYFKSNKNGNDRKVYIPDVSLEVLSTLHAEKINNQAIPSRNGKQLVYC